VAQKNPELEREMLIRFWNGRMVSKDVNDQLEQILVQLKSESK